ncbi:hypothetical protein G7082_04430 [Vagococcus hydrophili]|uniref:Uncharacterized protein n=2 Tax=Vagococcus hydrophili TaxID=2714947 RepID=A0A6G8ASD9_9ENTE|nr:hypothetical protein G7082_04430 [Vagococcus hydrophili]
MLVFIPFSFIILALLGGLKFVGVTYESNLSLLLFVLLLFVIELCVGNIVKLLLTWDSHLLMNFFELLISLYITNLLYDGVNIKFITMLIISVVLTILESLIDFISD